MYLSYYGLYKEPFHITPDPEFLFESPSHREAYATIVYGVARRKGFIAVTGEVGTGREPGGAQQRGDAEPGR